MGDWCRLWLVLSVLLLAGCSGAQPMDYHPATEIPQGPGLLSGESGVWGVSPQAAD